MHIICIGLNYRTAPVSIREKFAIERDQLPAALTKLKQTKSILECVIVATCNRTEIFAVVDRMHIHGDYIQAFMAQWFGIPAKEFSPYLYVHENDDAIRHLFRVTCGLDSMVIGETQILGQVRDALVDAQGNKTTGTLFNTLFKQAVTVAKRAHTETSIGENAVSVSYAAVELGKRIFGNFADKRVMIVGAGKMSELTVKHLHAGGAQEVIVANRTLDRAQAIAEQFQGIACSMEEMPVHLARADIIISSTGASQFVLTQEQVQRAMQKRKSRPLFLIDIAVPRDFDPEIASIPNVFLYDIDDLEGIVESNLEVRQKEAAKIELMLEDELAAFYQWYNTLGVGPVIRALQEKAASIHSETIDSLLNKLPELNERQRKVIRKLTKSIANQLMHDPINRIKEMAVDRGRDEALDMFVKMFALEESVDELAQQRTLTKASRSSSVQVEQESSSLERNTALASTHV